jgi:hypothetical protein
MRASSTPLPPPPKKRAAWRASIWRSLRDGTLAVWRACVCACVCWRGASAAQQ